MTTPSFTTPTSAETAKQFLAELHAAGMLFHPEDDPADCLSHHNLPVSTIDTIRQNMTATFEHLRDPCEAALDLVNG